VNAMLLVRGARAFTLFFVFFAGGGGVTIVSTSRPLGGPSARRFLLEGGGEAARCPDFLGLGFGGFSQMTVVYALGSLFPVQTSRCRQKLLHAHRHKQKEAHMLPRSDPTQKTIWVLPRAPLTCSSPTCDSPGTA